MQEKQTLKKNGNHSSYLEWFRIDVLYAVPSTCVLLSWLSGRLKKFGALSITAFNLHRLRGRRGAQRDITGIVHLVWS
jgi:hypothetical protein